MAKRRKAKKQTITEQRRKKLLRAVRRSGAAYSPGVVELIQKASPQKIRSLARDRNKNLHKMSQVKNPETASIATEKELKKLYKRLEERDRRKKEELIGVTEVKEPTGKDVTQDSDYINDLFDRVEEEPEAEPGKQPVTFTEYVDFVDGGDVMYNQIMDWIDTHKDKGKGETGKYTKEAFEEMVKKYGKKDVLMAVGALGEDIQEICERLTYYEGKEYSLEAARQSFFRSIETTLAFIAE